MNWEATITVPVAMLAGMGSIIILGIVGIFRGWTVPRPFHQAEIDRRLEEKKAKEDALDANKTLIETNNSLLRREDLSLTTIIEIRDYIYAHARDHQPPGGTPGEGGGSP